MYGKIESAPFRNNIVNIWFLNKITANILTNKTSPVLLPTITYIICALGHQSQQINSKTKVSILRPTLFIFKEAPSFGTKKNHKQLSFISLYANYNGIPLISLQNERKNLNKSSFEQLLSVYKITWEILSKKKHNCQQSLALKRKLKGVYAPSRE